MALPVRPLGDNSGKKKIEEDANFVDIESYDDVIGVEDKIFLNLDSEVDQALMNSLEHQTTEKNRSTLRRVAPATHLLEENSEAEFAYKKMGEITVDQALNEPYELYAHLDKKIEETVEWIQGLLTEREVFAKEIARARKQRGTDLFNKMSFEIDRLILRRINTGEAGVSGIDVKHFVAAVNNEVLGFGPLEPLWGDSSITEIMVNGPYEIRVEIKGRISIAKGVKFRSPKHLLDVAQQMLSLVGRRVDISMPLADSTLPDGSRLNVVHDDIAPMGPLMNIRRFPETSFSLKKLVDVESMTPDMAQIIGNFVHNGLSIVIVGGTGSGKTSALNALSGCIPDNDRVITVEDTLELRLNKSKHIASMQARPMSAKGTGGVSIRDLVRNALRQRPDRIVVGEVRDASAYDMLNAMNTGHEGSLTTVHANDAAGAVERISLLVSEEGSVTPERALSLIAQAVDAFLVIKRYEDGSRRVRGIYEVPTALDFTNGKLNLTPIPLYEFVQDSSETDTVVAGHYEKMNDVSESLTRKHALDKKPHLSLEQLYAISEVPEVLEEMAAFQQAEEDIK